MLFTRKTAVWLAILPSALAIDCTATNAVPIDLSAGGGDGGGGGGGGGSSTCTSLCGNDITCLGLCDGSTAAVGAIKGRNLNVRATLSCTSSETCVTVEGLLVCIDTVTGGFHDETGGVGNLITGDYTEGTGQDTTGGAAVTPTPVASADDSTPTSPSTSAPPLPSTSDTETETETETESESETKSETPANGTPTSGGSGSKTSAPAADRTSGVDGLSGRGAIVGALGLLAVALAN
ncbi:hypothetical protein V498_03394 [Pseudogymnoascus sp. VKM F-4517 (FW-2822)]|nr:hypothetical protein V498_03394 [Pseudogymnoascus sp. VKM F-4517 (FW-2822)]